MIGERELADLRNHFRATGRKFRQKLIWVGYKLLRSELSRQLMCSGQSGCSGLSWLLRLNVQRHHWNGDPTGQ